ncbi:MAG: LamB/YcsF family protein, partial [Solirubrobacteraceae bacterium]|nr:LamB/YcsF family protein [Solirubrobacteraceae bacterium]
MTAGPVIDLNADLGEGAGFDEELLELVSSANVACGAHAGDAATIVRTCLAAAERGVVVGAHPGYPDRAGFGRVEVELAASELRRSLAEQFAAITHGAQAAGLQPRYVKAHGALYHRAAADPQTAALLIGAAAALRPGAEQGPLVVLGPPGGAPAAAAGVKHVVEGFADRAYALDGAGRPTLAPRGTPGAILAHDAAVEQAVAL